MRLALLDSIRGWAAVAVMVLHVAREMFANKLPEFGTSWVAFLDGHFPVAIFFIVSGEALSHEFFVKNSIEPVRKLAIKRYLRLTIPIFLSCLAAFILMKTHLVFARQAALIVDRPDWLGGFLSFDPSIASFLSYSLFGVYFSHHVETSYNPVLWSMSVELAGSLFVFLTLLVARNRAQRWAAYAFAAPFMIVFSPFLICFIAGMGFAEMRVAGTFRRLAAHPAANWLCAISLACIVVGSSILPPLLGLEHKAVAQRVSVAAAAFLFAIYSGTLLQAPLNNRISHMLGELSFPLYLVHMPIIVSLQSYLILHFFPDGTVTRGTAYFIILATLAASLFAASAFVHVERFAIRTSNAFYAFVEGL